MLRLVTVIAAGIAATTATACAAQETIAPPPGPSFDMVTFEMKSWGEPVVSWRFTSQFGGSWTETERGDRLGNYTLVWHEIEPDVERYIALERILLQLPEQAPSSDDCDNFMTDLPYGTIRLTNGATTVEHAYNSGCMDEDYGAFLDLLRSANELVETWGKDAPVLRRETFVDGTLTPAP